MRQSRRPKYSLGERMEIIKDYETSDMSMQEIADKYGLNNKASVCQWRKELQDMKKSCTFASGNDAEVVEDASMDKKTNEQLEAELARVKEELHWSQLENLALNTMIDIAEEQGIQIRKKSGAKR